MKKQHNISFDTTDAFAIKIFNTIELLQNENAELKSRIAELMDEKSIILNENKKQHKRIMDLILDLENTKKELKKANNLSPQN